MASLKTAKITIDVSGRSVRIIQTNGSGKIVKAGSAPIREIPGTDHHIVLRDAIKEAAASAQIKGGKCVLLTGGPDIITQQFMLPDMADDALRENILTEITQYLSGDIGKFTIDFRVTGLADKPGEKTAEAGKKLGVFAAAFEKTAAASLMHAATKAGFTPERLDIRENARDKLMKLKDKIQGFDPTKSFAVLDVSDYPANIMIFVNGRFYVSRYFESVLDTESTDDPEEIAALYIESLSAEIASIIDYIQYRERDSKIEHILVFGSKQSVSAIREKLEENLDMPVINAGKVYSGISKTKKRGIAEHGVEFFLDAYAASIRGKTKLSADLDLKRQKKKRRVSGRAIMAIILTVLIVGSALAAGIYLPYIKIQALKEDNRRVTRELENYVISDALAQIADLEKEIDLMTGLTSEYRIFSEYYPDASRLLDWIYNAATRDMKIMNVSASRGSISLSGTAASEESLANYMDYLVSDRCGLFNNARISTAYTGETSLSFQITLYPVYGR